MSMLCSMSRIDVPCALSSSTRSMMNWSSVGLTPAAGSSSRIVSGSAIRTRASSSSLRWPPESTRAGSPSSRDSVTKSSSALAFSTAARSSAATRPGRSEVQPGALAGLVLAAGQHVLQHRHLGEGSWDLEGAADAAGDARARGPRASESAPAIRIAARARPEASGEQVEQRRLAGAVRPDQAEQSRRARARSTCRRRRASRRKP